MKMKAQFINHIRCLVLVLVMVTALLSITSITSYADTQSEAKEIPSSANGFMTYSNNVTVYYKYNHYLYKAVVTNLKNVSDFTLHLETVKYKGNPATGLALSFHGTDASFHSEALLSELSVFLLSQLPTEVGNSVSLSADHWQPDYYKPNDTLVTITCIDINEPTWSWTDISSATATFTAKDADVFATAEASISSQTVSQAENCQTKEQVNYTAAVMFNGQTYTAMKTADGAVGPHDIKYLHQRNAITANCTVAGCSLNTGNSVSLKAEDVYYYTGSPIAEPVTGAFNHNLAVYKVTYNGSTDVPSDVGSYWVMLNVYDENGKERAGKGDSFRIEYLPSPLLNEFYVEGYSYQSDGRYWFREGAAVTVNPPAGYSISKSKTGNFVSSVSFGENENKIVYLKRDSDGARTDAIDLNSYLKWDTSVPTGMVQLSTGNFWTQLVNEIGFNILLKEPASAVIEVQDGDSGVKSVEYYIANHDLINGGGNAALEDAVGTGWQNYNGNILINSDGKYIVYVKVTDNVGHVTYLSTDGVEYDGIAPVIEGIENGKTYYTTQSFTVEESNLDSVTVNGTPFMTFVLEGNIDKEYVIAAADKAGNTTTVTVTMKPIKELAKATEDLDNDNVTSADAPVLKELIEKLDELIADSDTSDGGERETLEQYKVIAESLLQTIEDAAKAIVTENIIKVKDITAKNVTPEDKTDLEKAKTDLKKALEEKAGNYTEDEKKAIKDEIKRIDDALSALKKPAGPKSPQTGDESNMFLWIIILFISGGAVIIFKPVKNKF